MSSGRGEYIHAGILFVHVATHVSFMQCYCLSFHKIKHGILHSIIFKCNETKMDKMGAFVQEKNVYSNSLACQGHLVSLLRWGFISPCIRITWLRQSSSIDPRKTVRECYLDFCMEIAKRNYVVVRHYCRLSHFDIHGLCKGGGHMPHQPPLFPLIQYHCIPREVVNGEDFGCLFSICCWW